MKHTTTILWLLLLAGCAMGVPSNASKRAEQYTYSSGSVVYDKAAKAIKIRTGESWLSPTGETIVLTAYGSDSIRVQSSFSEVRNTYLNGLLPLSDESRSSGSTRFNLDQNVTFENGNLRAIVTPEFQIIFERVSDGKVLLAEKMVFHHHGVTPRWFEKSSSTENVFKIQSRFESQDEKIYGMGQHVHGFLDQKGLRMRLNQVNTEVSIPFYLSSLGYGFLWNQPSQGEVFFGFDETVWEAYSAHQLDYWVTTWTDEGSYSDIMRNYVDAVGHARPLPHLASGFWQSKNRYRNQSEFLEVASEYRARDLDVSVMVIDYHHWLQYGDWSFDPQCWPDPQAMSDTLHRNGTEIMVSVWPLVSPQSSNYDAVVADDLLVHSLEGIPDRGDGNFIYDPFNPSARKFVWSQVHKNYVQYGIKVFWLDADEPELSGEMYEHTDLVYYEGTHATVGNMFPLYHQQTFFDGLSSINESDIVMLSRSAWVGSQRYGVAVWSGDIESTFESLGQQIRAAQNIQLSGIAWWTTDIGGYFDGNITDPHFQELVVRWFQFGATCPLFRLHGCRVPVAGEGTCGWSCGPNEVWKFGSAAYYNIVKVMSWRESMREYVEKELALTAATGTPFNRPLWYDFATDPNAWEVDDQYMVGSQYMMAPVYEYGARSRTVYLPAGVSWMHFFTEELFEGGETVTIDVPIDSFALFVRMEAKRAL